MRKTGSLASSATAGRGDSGRATIWIMDGASLLAFLLDSTKCTGIPDGSQGRRRGLNALDASEESSLEERTSEGVGVLGKVLSLVLGGARGGGAGERVGVAAMAAESDPSS